jgi:hypothetical protein
MKTITEVVPAGQAQSFFSINASGQIFEARVNLFPSWFAGFSDLKVVVDQQVVCLCDSNTGKTEFAMHVILRVAGAVQGRKTDLTSGGLDAVTTHVSTVSGKAVGVNVEQSENREENLGAPFDVQFMSLRPATISPSSPVARIDGSRSAVSLFELSTKLGKDSVEVFKTALTKRINAHETLTRQFHTAGDYIQPAESGDPIRAEAINNAVEVGAIPAGAVLDPNAVAGLRAKIDDNKAALAKLLANYQHLVCSMPFHVFVRRLMNVNLTSELSDEERLDILDRLRGTLEQVINQVAYDQTNRTPMTILGR